ncbi:MAG: toll/interleukin-1 receptor domain-containing protein [Caulobacterales bacterium]
MPDVFISYKRQERPRVEAIASALADLGADVWFDAHILPGEYFDETLRQEAIAAKAILACVTPEALRSAWVLEEMRIGLARSCLIIAFLTKTALPEEFARVHAADLCDWDGKLDHEGWLAVMRALGKNIGEPSLAMRSLAWAGGQDPVMVAILRRLLVAKARAQEAPFTYKEAENALRAAAEAERIPISTLVQPTLWGALDKIAEQDRIARAPPLCALVVSEETGLPGKGYFQKHAFLSDQNDPLAEAVHARHVELVYRYPWPQD